MEASLEEDLWLFRLSQPGLTGDTTFHPVDAIFDRFLRLFCPVVSIREMKERECEVVLLG